jgi:hypothetical protein
LCEGSLSADRIRGIGQFRDLHQPTPVVTVYDSKPVTQAELAWTIPSIIEAKLAQLTGISS